MTIKDGIVTGSLPRCALRLVYEWIDLHLDPFTVDWNVETEFAPRYLYERGMAA